jgi:hypothetical protein
MPEWETIGEVMVDSATLAVIDAAYADRIDLLEPWEGFVHPIVSEGGATLGTLILPGLGDGLYPVEARFEDVEGWGRRIAEVRIRFLDEDSN